MLKHVYIHNFRCLINFEASFSELNLLMGNNGAGKSTVFYVLKKIQDLIIEGKKIDALFSRADKTSWLNSNIQTIKLKFEGNSGIYDYILEIEYNTDRGLVRIIKEQLHFDGEPLYVFSIEANEEGYPISHAYLYNDNHTHDGIPIIADWSRSALSMIEERHDNKKLIWFKEQLEKIYILKIVPSLIKSETREEALLPNIEADNFSSWFRILLQEQRRGIRKLEEELSAIFQTEVFFSLDNSGDAKILRIELGEQKYRLDELSDGQKVLIILYTLLTCIADDSILCIDEPENFLALPEIQPWLNFLHDFCDEGGQALLISHHPILINLLAKGQGIWFSRQQGEHSLTKKISAEKNSDSLSIANLVERGWLYEQ